MVFEGPFQPKPFYDYKLSHYDLGELCSSVPVPLQASWNKSAFSPFHLFCPDPVRVPADGHQLPPPLDTDTVILLCIMSKATRTMVENTRNL